MSQNVELNKVKARIKALSNKTVDRGCSEHEAMQAMAAVGRLLAQYNLTMSEIDVREQVCKTIKIELPGQRRGASDGCVTALADLFDARTWFDKRYEKDANDKWIKKTAYAFFGTENDLDMIEYLHQVIIQSIETELAIFKRGDIYKNSHAKKSATTSFQHGMAHRIAHRLRDLKRQIDAEINAAPPVVVEDTEAAPAEARIKTSHALVALKGQLIAEEFKKNGPKLRSYGYTSRIRHGSAYSEGQIAGARVNLSRPIAGTKVSGLL